MFVNNAQTITGILLFMICGVMCLKRVILLWPISVLYTKHVYGKFDNGYCRPCAANTFEIISERQLTKRMGNKWPILVVPVVVNTACI